MPGGDDDRLAALSAENASLRDRIAELERTLAGSEGDPSGSREFGTALIEREALLTEAERIAHMGSWVWDVRTNRVGWSDELYRILGYDPARDAPSAEAYFARVHPDDLTMVREASERLIRTRVSERLEYRALLPGGEIRHVSLDSALLFDKAGELLGLVGTLLDVTESRKSAERLELAAEEHAHLEERLRQAQKMEALGQLAGGIAHDFNNLLTIILGGVETARFGRQTEQALADIEGAARSAATLTQRLLAFSRRALVAPKILDLRAVVEEIRPMIARTIPEDVRTSFEYTGEPCTTVVDAGYAHQVLINLVVNARDAMPDGGHLAIRVERVVLSEAEIPELPAGRYAVVSVRDSGIGMDRDTIGHIFEPFFTTKEAGKGTGLGLSLVYGAMKQCGGAVTVESSPGGGTTFRLYFPATEEAEASGPSKVRIVPHPPRVLLVEDDALVRRVVAETLRRIGSPVVAVESGKEAIVAWKERKEPIELLVTDVVMPEMRGEDVAKNLLALDPSLKVLFITGYVDRTLDMTAFRTARVLRKPFSSDELVRVLNELA